MRDLLRDVEGLDIRIVGPKVIIDGEVLVPQDYGRIYMVVSDKAYVDFVMNRTTLSPLAIQVLARKIQDDVHAFAPSVTTRVVNGVIFLEGTVDAAYKAGARGRDRGHLPARGQARRRSSSATRRRSTAAARRLVQNFIIVDPPPPKRQEKLIRVTVHFVQLSKDYSKLFAFKWAPGFTPGPDQLQLGQSATRRGGVDRAVVHRDDPGASPEPERGADRGLRARAQDRHLRRPQRAGGQAQRVHDLSDHGPGPERHGRLRPSPRPSSSRSPSGPPSSARAKTSSWIWTWSRTTSSAR